MVEDNLEMLLEIYETVADPTLWPRVLDRFADTVDARGCIVFAMDGIGSGRKIAVSHISERYDPKVLMGYLDAFSAYELADQDHFEATSLAADGVDLIDDGTLAAMVPDFDNRPNVQAMRSVGVEHRAACLLDKDNKRRFRFSVQFTAEQGAPTNQKLAEMNVFLPHIAKAMALSNPVSQLAQSNRALVAAMDRLGIGICILDARGSVAVANEEFRRQEQDYDAFHFDSDGKLYMRDPKHARSLALLSDNATHHGRFGARPRKEAITAGSDDLTTTLCIDIAPLEHSQEFGSRPLSGTVLFSLDTSRPIDYDQDLMQQTFSLTQAEASLVELISAGLSNSEIAARRDRSVETVKSQIQSLLAKTQCANRTQLVRMLTGFNSGQRLLSQADGG